LQYRKETPQNNKLPGTIAKLMVSSPGRPAPAPRAAGPRQGERDDAMTNAALHLVLGAGQVGPRVAELLLARGHRVRVARRGGPLPGLPGVEAVSLDVRDAAAVARAAEGAAVVYNCVNPLYHQWPEMLWPMTKGVVDGAASAGARLVALDCLYMYGDTARMSEATPPAPVSKKGALRQRAAEYVLGADARGAVRAAIGRAADFFGPGAHLSVFGEHFFPRVLAGKKAYVFGDPDMPHSYSYTPDVAAALVALGERDDARGVYMLPVQPAESTRSVVGRIAAELGREIAIAGVPAWALRAAGVVSPMVRELAEMTYQWRQPFVVDDAKFRATFGLAPTPWGEAIAQTVAWARARYAAGRAAALPRARATSRGGRRL
jgi:nucleoside-diphosphate-sugar epimerase